MSQTTCPLAVTERDNIETTLQAILAGTAT
jgi:hypothetical protein